MAEKAGYPAMDCECPIGGDGVRTHPADCPSVAWVKDVQKRIQPDLDDMARKRRKAEAEARFHVIG